MRKDQIRGSFEEEVLVCTASERYLKTRLFKDFLQYVRQSTYLSSFLVEGRAIFVYDACLCTCCVWRFEWIHLIPFSMLNIV